MHHVFVSPYGLNVSIWKVKVAEIRLAVVIAMVLTEVSCTNHLHLNGKTVLIPVLPAFIKVELGLFSLYHISCLRF
jgi:hypothetical protein